MKRDLVSEQSMRMLRSLFSYLQTYGYTGANPAHSYFVQAPSVPRGGNAVGLSPQDCRRLLEASDSDTPVGFGDRAILGVLAYSACRVGNSPDFAWGTSRRAADTNCSNSTASMALFHCSTTSRLIHEYTCLE